MVQGYRTMICDQLAGLSIRTKEGELVVFEASDPDEEDGIQVRRQPRGPRPRGPVKIHLPR